MDLTIEYSNVDEKPDNLEIIVQSHGNQLYSNSELIV